MIRYLSQFTLLIILLLLSQSGIASDDTWYFKAKAYAQQTNYQDSTIRESLDSAGLVFSIDYLDKSELKLGIFQQDIKFLPTSSITDVEETGVLLAYQHHFFSDAGRFTLRLDAYHIENESNFIDMIDIANPIIAYINNTKTFYADLGYSVSLYRADNPIVEDLDITQITPTLGFGLNDNFDWLQLRGYFISPSLSSRLPDDEDKSAVEIKWIHWFNTNILSIDKIVINLLGGERLFAVDSDTNTVYNLADIQTKSAALSIDWKLGKSTHLVVSGGSTDYESLLSDEIYSSKYVYLNISTQW